MVLRSSVILGHILVDGSPLADNRSLRLCILALRRVLPLKPLSFYISSFVLLCDNLIQSFLRISFLRQVSASNLLVPGVYDPTLGAVGGCFFRL